MGALLRFCRDFKLHPLALDHGLALTLLALNLLVPGSRHVGERIQLTPTVVVLVVVAAVALALRRLAPLVVLGVTTAVTSTYVIIEQGKSPILLFTACAVYTVVMEKDRRTRSIAVAAAAVVTLMVGAPASNGNVLDNLGAMLLILFAGAAAEAVRYRRALQQELEERALRAEQSRDEEARRRVAEERLRIAHELHDVIAHHIALMNVQSGVAAHVLRSQPEEAERALALVRSGGRTVLQELTVLLGVLRRSGTSLPTAPTPSLHEVDALVDSFAAAGVKVDWELPDSLGELPDVIELTAYRIVQESLTNVLKHAPGAAAQIRLTRHPGSLAVDITNTAPTPAGLAAGKAAPPPPASDATSPGTRPAASSSGSAGVGARSGATSPSHTAHTPSGAWPGATTSAHQLAPAPRGASPSATASPGAGHGLLGMRERVEAVGGELRTGPEPGGGFGVHAVLPLETGVVGDDPGAAGRRPDADPQRVPGAGELSTRFGGHC